MDCPYLSVLNVLWILEPFSTRSGCPLQAFHYVPNPDAINFGAFPECLMFHSCNLVQPTLVMTEIGGSVIYPNQPTVRMCLHQLLNMINYNISYKVITRLEASS